MSMRTKSERRATSPQHPAVLLCRVQPPSRAALARQHVRVVLQQLHPVACATRMPTCQYSFDSEAADEAAYFCPPCATRKPVLNLFPAVYDELHDETFAGLLDVHPP